RDAHPRRTVLRPRPARGRGGARRAAAASAGRSTGAVLQPPAGPGRATVRRPGDHLRWSHRRDRWPRRAAQAVRPEAGRARGGPGRRLVARASRRPRGGHRRPTRRVRPGPPGHRRGAGNPARGHQPRRGAGVPPGRAVPGHHFQGGRRMTTTEATRVETAAHGTSTWTAARLVAEREIRSYLRMKGFWIGLALVVAGIFAMSILPGVVGAGSTSVAVVGQASDALQTESGFDVRTVPDENAARELVRSEEVEAAVVPDNQGVRVIALSEAPMDVIAALTTAPPVDLLEQGDVSSGERQLVIMVFALLFLIFSMGGLAIAQSTVTEKQTRIVEILVAAVPVR